MAVPSTPLPQFFVTALDVELNRAKKGVPQWNVRIYKTEFATFNIIDEKINKFKEAAAHLDGTVWIFVDMPNETAQIRRGPIRIKREPLSGINNNEGKPIRENYGTSLPLFCSIS